ncbi:AraC family transcriptional regulator [Streptomyces sp. NPDC002520]
MKARDIQPVDQSGQRESPSVVAERSTAFTTAMNLTARQIAESRRPFEVWEDGPFGHLTGLAVPRSEAAGGFKFAANGHLFDSLLSVKVYCDSLTGISGSGQEQDPVVADLVASGSLRYLGKHGESVVGPGQVCIRDTRASWRFSCAPGTRIRVVTIPRQVLVSRVDSPRVFNRAYVADVKTPEVRFLLNFLEMIERSAHDLDRSAFAQDLALNACASLFSGMLAERAAASLCDHPRTILEVAKSAIEDNVHKSDLSPAMIAGIVGVSVRTLHRSFAAAEDSVMAFARRRRLAKAHDDLLGMGSTASVSELAARWHFADTSHFIRHFKSFYGTTPAAYVKNRDGAPRFCAEAPHD